MSNNATSAPRIVVGVDGSEPSKAALRLAADQAELVGGVVDAIFAWEFPTSWYGLAPPAVTKPATTRHELAPQEPTWAPWPVPRETLRFTDSAGSCIRPGAW
ncbi:universal stress protein [Streptomyces sp. NPDC050121]|uniref:universal stress protein n=1 Tax=Streptomyces sp. NPDC050121 TaxID=3365601 RepID=UPI0037B5ECF7